MKLETIVIHGGYSPDSTTKSRCVGANLSKEYQKI